MITNPTDEHREQARADSLPPLQTLYAMFEEWRMSFPPEHRPERNAPTAEQLIDAWIAGFAKHNEITCAARVLDANQRDKQAWREGVEAAAKAAHKRVMALTAIASDCDTDNFERADGEVNGAIDAEIAIRDLLNNPR